MSDTKESILMTALHLFAREGYEAVSTNTIAGELGMTKGALYKHYKSKRDIFDSIVERMYRIDAENSEKHDVPVRKYEDGCAQYRDISVKAVREFTVSQFLFWTEDKFAADFRRMLTLEQYRSSEMSKLYGSCIAEGPVAYMADIFREMTAQGILGEADSYQLAVEYYAPFFLLLSIADRSDDKGRCVQLLNEHIERFFRINSVEYNKKERAK